MQYAPPSKIDLDVLCDETAVLRDAGAVADDRGVALRRRRDVLVAVVDHAHRLAEPLCQQRRVDGDHRRVFLFATEAATGLSLDDDGLLHPTVATRASCALWM